MRNEIISSLVLKRMCYILLKTWKGWWLNIRRHIKLAPSPQHVKQEKGKRGEKKKGKEEARNLWKQKKKRMPYFPFSGRSPLAEDFAPDIFGISQLETVDCETLHLFISKTDKACLRNLCSCKLFCQGSPGDCLVLLHLRVNELKTVLWGRCLSTNGLFGTLTDVAASYVLSWIWPCNRY